MFAVQARMVNAGGIPETAGAVLAAGRMLYHRR
jgi:hypothetical protein